jgi:hypothetical protein
VDDKTRELAAQLERCRTAEQAVHESERARLAHEAMRDALEGDERERLEGGAARAADLQARERWREGQNAELARLRGHEALASEQLNRERGARELVRRELCRADVAKEVVGKHHARWRDAELARRERAEEDAALETHAARSILDRRSR